ncbi:type I toxin-antitoxin system SymE family toxin [Sodalis ligni]|uniref:SymE family type I addiction module toxin n=1 Tax=Sodalis ligni TaxID=2697027 RepID=UPI00193FD7D2|nr:SymE family type I addiction module toxin [Sodalis ligni]QWA11612.1 type I toxin-antitoxin system SymE family toxin [Sodalis ligni]
MTPPVTTAAVPTYYSRHPGLYLKGDWLGEAGFATGQPVRVMVEPGRLVILPEAG